MVMGYLADRDKKPARKKPWLRNVVAVMVMILLVTGFTDFAIGANPSPAKIMLNGVELVSDQSPAIVNSRIMLPMRVIFEALGAEVSWDPVTKTVKGIKRDSTVVLRIGSSNTEVNGRKMYLDCPARIIADRTFVPIRFVAESLNMEVSWDSNSRIATIEDELYAAAKHKMVVGDKQIYLGQKKDDLVKQIGTPARIDPGESGLQWYIYNSDYRRYLQIGIKDNVVMAAYTNAALFTFDSRLYSGMTREALQKAFNDQISAGSRVVQIGTEGMRATVFIDIHNNNKVTSILMEANSIRNNGGNKAALTPGVMRAYELQLFDLANAVRAREGLVPYVYNDKLSNIARLHSQDMAERNFFSHDNLQGESPFDRMKKNGVVYLVAAENIAAGQGNAIYAHEEWMNSKGHRVNILEDIELFGAGVAANSEGRLYYTQNFYTLCK